MYLKTFSIFISACIFCTVSKAQFPGKTIWANTADIKDANEIVVAKMVIIPGLKREIFLKSCNQQLDSGLYVTEFTFSKPNHEEAKDFVVVLQFNKKFKAVYFNTEGNCDNFRTTIADNKLGTSFQSSNLSGDGVISVK